MYFLTSEFEKKKLLFSLQSRCSVFEHLSIVCMPCIPNLCRICLTFNHKCNLFSQFYLCSIHFIQQAFIYIYRIYLNLNDVQYLDILKFTNNFVNLFYCHFILKLNIFLRIAFMIMLENGFYFEQIRLKTSNHLNTDSYIYNGSVN